MSGDYSTSYKVGGSLAGIVGIGATVLLFTNIPAEESGRKVAVVPQKDNTVLIQHVGGPQYLNAYLDIVKVPTACDGITRGVRVGQTYSDAQCNAMLEKELVIHAQGVMACTPGLQGAGRDNQRYAAVSLAYNVGVAGYCGSTVARKFNAKDYRGGCDALLLWVKAGGKIVRGLVSRRERERAVCLRGLK